MMLLPSALDCAPGIQPMRSVYTTNTVLSPPPSHRQSTNSPANLFSTCRALQSLITTNLTPPPTIAKPSCAQPSLASPIILAPANRKRAAQAPQPSTSTNAPQPQTPPPASKKRRRSDSDNENRPPPNQTEDTTLPSTPKRQRLCPPTLPLGLSRADFSALQAEAAAIPIPSTPQAPLRRRRHQLTTHPNIPPSSTSPTILPSHSPDSNALISLILQKLHLSQSDWEQCAHKLGQGKENSIGERFRMLLGNEGVGLRRGCGKRRRKSVAGMEFGPLLGG